MDMKGSWVDRVSIGLAQWVVRYRYLIILLAVAGCVAIGSGAKQLQFSSNYRVFFSGENPDLNNFETFQSVYTKNDNFLFVVTPEEGSIYSQESLEAIKQITERAWQIPYANRVDSLTNFQHSYGVDDDLVVEDLVEDPAALDAQALAKLKLLVESEPLIHQQFASGEGSAAAVNVTLQYPGKELTELPAAVAEARAIKAEIEKDFPGTKVYLTGFSMLNNAFAEAGFMDTVNLMPIMFLLFLITAVVTLRSISGVIASTVVVVLCMMVGMGVGGHMGVLLTPISNSAPIVILTLAVADAVHIIITMRKLMRQGYAKYDALIESMRLNFVPVSVTSITTIVGFLALNFADSPPYWHLGNMASAGIFAAWLLSLTLLPALLSLLPFRVRVQDQSSRGATGWTKFGRWTAANAKVLLLSGVAVTLALAAAIPSVKLEDSWSDYFSEKIEFRRDTDAATQEFGLYPVEYSVPSRGPQGIADAEYLAHLERFTAFLREQPNVAHVYSMSDVFKKLNRNMHAEDASYYRVPEDSALAAQYLLLYELSLPYGQDLNDRVNVDKSATRVTVTLNKVTTEQTKQFLTDARAWMQDNLPAYMHTEATSGQVMFSYIAERNVQSMVGGTLLALVLIAAVMTLALRSVKMGLLSLVPNCLPIVAGFGVWSLVNGAVGFSVAAIASISLGIVVDDTVHLLTKYNYARRQGKTAQLAIDYALNQVGSAILINTAILVAGFAVMASSTFKISADLGLLTMIVIIIAAVLDFFLLPAVLYLLDKPREKSVVKMMSADVSSKVAGTSTSVIAAIGLMFMAVLPNETEAATDVEKQGFDIFARSDRSDRGFGDSRVAMTMTLENAAGETSSRTLVVTTLEVPDEAVGDKSLVQFQTPLDIKGTALLSHAKILEPDNQWIYLPSMKRVKRISSKNKSGPFVGSEFAFEDLTSLDLMKYEHAYLDEEQCGGLTCDVIQSRPKYEHSGYSFLKIWIDQQDFQIRKVEFYDRRESLLKTLTMADYRQYDTFWRPHVLDMQNHLTGKRTTLNFSDYEFQIGLSDGDFVKGKLGRL